jgi:hypothetical protein
MLVGLLGELMRCDVIAFFVRGRGGEMSMRRELVSSTARCW